MNTKYVYLLQNEACYCIYNYQCTMLLALSKKFFFVLYYYVTKMKLYQLQICAISA
jgi:hypothetical protein